MSAQHAVSTIIERATDGIALAAIAALAAPDWPAWLATVSQDAALALPILGCLWLIVQIGCRLIGKKVQDDD